MHLSHLMKMLTHGDAVFSHAFLHVNILQELVGNHLQGILRPGLSRSEWNMGKGIGGACEQSLSAVAMSDLEPINGAAVDQ